MKKHLPDKQQIKRAFIATLPVMAGYLVLGIGFGIAGIAYARKCEKYRARSAMATWGKILSIIGLVWSILVSSPFITVVGGMISYELMRINFG